MAVLSKPSDIGIKPGTEIRMKMAAVKIYQGGAVGVVSGTGYATPLLVATSGITFVGVAEETVDNSAGSAGDLWIRVRRTGLVGWNSSGLTIANISNKVYFVSGSDDNTVSATVSAILAGTLSAFDSNSVAWVNIDQAVATYGTGNSNAVTSEGVVSGGSFQATHASSTAKNYPLGTKREYPDGRIYRYGYTGTGGVSSEFGAVSPRKVAIASAAAPVQATGGSLGDSTFTVTVASGDGIAADGVFALNSLVGGYVWLDNGTSRHPQCYGIVGNTATTGAGTMVITLDEPLFAAVVATTTSSIEVFYNPWAYVTDGNVTNSAYVSVIGMPSVTAVAARYMWFQRRGPVWVTSDSLTGEAANGRDCFFQTNGSIVSASSTTYACRQRAGYAMDLSAANASNSPLLFLQLE